VPREDGTYLVDAALPFPEFLRYFDIEPEEDPEFSKINTVGGLVFYIAKRIPETGFKLSWKNLSIEIIDMDGRRVDKVLVRREVAEDVS
jgi:putative hemolysin